MEGKVCIKCGVWKPLEEYNKNKDKKDGRRSNCRECQKQHYQNNKERYKEYSKQYYQNNKEYIKEYKKQWRENNREHLKERDRQYCQNNKEHLKEYRKQWRENNREYIKEYRKDNKEHLKEQLKQWRENNPDKVRRYSKQHYQNSKENNLQYISNMVKRINPIFKQLNLPIYGYVYMFENIKTGHKYVGQSINPIKIRYNGNNIVQGWIKERLEKDTQKFKEELIKEDFIVTEVLDVAFCQYHLDKLEAYYINQYDSFLNGYNNNAGKHDTDDGIEEFIEILQRYNLEFVDGQILKKAN